MASSPKSTGKSDTLTADSQDGNPFHIPPTFGNPLLLYHDGLFWNGQSTACCGCIFRPLESFEPTTLRSLDAQPINQGRVPLSSGDDTVNKVDDDNNVGNPCVSEFPHHSRNRKSHAGHFGSSARRELDARRDRAEFD